MTRTASLVIFFSICKGEGIEMTNIMGLPTKTLVIVGGLFVISTLAPSITALMIKGKKGWEDE